MERFPKVIFIEFVLISIHIFKSNLFSHLGFTDPVTVKFANTPNAAKSMIGLPLAPSYLSPIPATQQPVLTTVPSIRPALNRYRYAARIDI